MPEGAAPAQTACAGQDAALCHPPGLRRAAEPAAAGLLSGRLLLPEGRTICSRRCWTSCAWGPIRSSFWTGCRTAPPSMSRWSLPRDCGRGQASGLVNAVLRKLAANKDSLPPVPDRDAAAYLCHPLQPSQVAGRSGCWPLLGREEAEAFLRADNAAAPTDGPGQHLLKTTPEALPAALEAAGRPGDAATALGARLSGALAAPGDLTSSGCLSRRGSSRSRTARRPLASPMAAGRRAGEAGAGRLRRPRRQDPSPLPWPWGTGARSWPATSMKTSSAASEAGASAWALTCIAHRGRWTGRIFRAEWESAFDVVLVDAPCSGLGIIRKKPDIRYKKRRRSFGPAGGADGPFWTTPAAMCSPAALLLYSTCTILPEENEAGDGRVSRQAPRTFPGKASSCRHRLVQEDGQVTLWPQRHGTDGFYICRMRRKHDYDMTSEVHDRAGDHRSCSQVPGGARLSGQAGLLLAPPGASAPSTR